MTDLTFIGIYPSQKGPVAAFRGAPLPRLRGLPKAVLFAENSLRARIANRQASGESTAEEERALAALLEAKKATD